MYICHDKNWDIIMHTLPPIMFKMTTRVVYFLVCTSFFFLFLITYNPFHLDTVLDMEEGLYTFNVSIMTAIVFVVLAALGTAFHFLKNAGKVTWAHFILWCMGEVAILSMFISLYIFLMLGGEVQYFTVLLRCVGYCYLIFIFPYVILTLAYDISAMHIRELYINADENYVNIFYQEGSRTKKYVLRCSMRSLEETAEKHGLVRSQRSYYLNPSHVTILRKDAGGQLIAELDVEGLPSIPVSKRYQDSLAKML